VAVEIRESTFENSRELLAKFQRLENSYGADWYDCEEESAKYIWLIENIENPLGFLSYKVLVLPNQIDFIYIVKIYILKSHRGQNPTRIEEERVSEILFRQIDRKDVNILTLESACEELDVYYQSLGFKYNEEMSEIFAKVIGTREQIMYRARQDKNKDIPDELNGLFGV